MLQGSALVASTLESEILPVRVRGYRPTDLDELPTGDDDTAPSRQPDRERHRGGIVVRDQGILGAGEREEMLLGRAEAGATPAARAVELEHRIAARGRSGRLDRGARPGRPAEVRVKDDPRRVDRRDETGPERIGEGVEASEELGSELRCFPRNGVRVGRQAAALLGHDPARNLRDRLAVPAGSKPRPGPGEHPLHAWWPGMAYGRHLSVVLLAGAHGSRTHRAAPNAAPPVLKTRGPTGTQPLPMRW